MNFVQLMHQGIADPSHSIANKGGGSSGTPYYANMDQLYGAQAQAANFMLDQSMPRVPTYMANSESMVGDAMSGKLAQTARNTAAADANQSMSMGLQAANRNMQRYGAEFNPAQLAASNRQAAIEGAKLRTGAMNNASQWAEDQKWNRNAGALAQATGMGSGAMSGLSSAGAGFGGMAGQMAGQDAANAQGFGQFGAAMAKSAFADGGEVRGLKRGVKLAAGGDAWAAWKKQNPISMGGVTETKSNPLGAMAMGAAPIVVGEALKEAKVGSMFKEGVNKGIGAAKNAFGLGSAPVADAATTAAADSVSTLAFDPAGVASGEAISSGVNMAGATEGLALGADAAGTAAGTAAGAEAAAVGTAATEAAGAGAAGAAGGGAMAGLATAAPWLIGGYAVGSLLDLWADGGDVDKPGGLRRKDFRPGGKVEGPGTETSDSIPAHLSKGEVVENAEAVKLPVDTTKAIIDEWEAKGGTTKELLLDINDAGKAKRQGLRVSATKSGEPAFAGGGFLGGNLGIALGAGVQEMKAQNEEARKQKIAENQQKLFEQQQSAYQRDNELRAKRDAVMADPTLSDEGRVKALALLDSTAFTQNFTADRAYNLDKGKADATARYMDGQITEMGLGRALREKLSQNEIAAQLEIARIRERGANARANAGPRNGYELAALTAEGQPLYRKAGEMGLFMDDGKGGAVRYSGDLSKVKGFSNGKSGSDFTKAPDWVQKRLYEIEALMAGARDSAWFKGNDGRPVFDGDLKKLEAERDLLLATSNLTAGTNIPVPSQVAQAQGTQDLMQGYSPDGAPKQPAPKTGLREANSPPSQVGGVRDKDGNIQLLNVPGAVVDVADSAMTPVKELISAGRQAMRTTAQNSRENDPLSAAGVQQYTGEAHTLNSLLERVAKNHNAALGARRMDQAELLQYKREKAEAERVAAKLAREIKANPDKEKIRQFEELNLRFQDSFGTPLSVR